MMLRNAIGLAAMAAALFAQPTPSAQPAQPALEFEVASIHPVGPIQPTQGQQVSAGIHVDGQQFKGSFLALRDYLCMAFSVRVHQLQGPDWLASERYDINATMPPLPASGTFKEGDLSAMMRILLEQRFQVKYHRESKDVPVYALVQLKGGIKAQENALDPLDSKGGVTVGGTGGAQGTAISLGRGSTMTIGTNRIAGTKLAMSVLADTLGRFVDKPVMDQTGLTATYDISLDLSPEDFQALMIRAALGSGVTLPPQALKILDTASGDSLHEALARVGLKLEAKKAPMDMVVIDSINRTPSEN